MDSFGSLLIFLILVTLVKPNKRYDGQVMLAWCFLYPLLRFSDEFFRGDTERGVYTSLHISAGQFTSMAIALAALVMLILLRRKAGTERLDPAPA
jgi:phosphatidylglycerol:prolipoprotein diacylglycerol transferase